MDYTTVTEILSFEVGDVFGCIDVTIIEDGDCELDVMEDFFADLVYAAGLLPIVVGPSRTRVVIEEINEPECGTKFTCDMCYGNVFVLLLHNINWVWLSS